MSKEYFAPFHAAPSRGNRPLWRAGYRTRCWKFCIPSMRTRQSGVVWMKRIRGSRKSWLELETWLRLARSTVLASLLESDLVPLRP